MAHLFQQICLLATFSVKLGRILLNLGMDQSVFELNILNLFSRPTLDGSWQPVSSATEQNYLSINATNVMKNLYRNIDRVIWNQVFFFNLYQFENILFIGHSLPSRKLATRNARLQ